MNTIYTAKITEIFYSVDEFCKQLELQFKKKAIGKDGKKEVHPTFGVMRQSCSAYSLS